MNLFFRLLYVYLFSRYRQKQSILEECITPFRVGLTDLDILRHMNNGVYFSLQDLARVDYMIRAGAAKEISRRGWYPVVASEMIRFRRSLKLFQSFEIRTRLIAWDEKSLYLEHKFTSRDNVIAVGMIRARFLSKKGGTVSPQQIFEAVGFKTPSPAFPAHLQSWIDADLEHSRSLGL